MKKEELRIIYDREHSQAGDTQEDFYLWAIDYLLNIKGNKKLLTQIKRHLKGIEKAVKELEEN